MPAFFGMQAPARGDLAFEYERMPETRACASCRPIVFGAARDGDAVARAIIDRLADEVAEDGDGAIIRQLHLTRRDPVVTLAGGVFRAEDPVFEARIEAGVHAVAPAARVQRLDAPPVLGAALLGLDRLRDSAASGPRRSTRLRADSRPPRARAGAIARD